MGSYSLILLAQQEPQAAGTPWDLYIPFFGLHFLEFAIWGAWFVVLGNYLNALGFSRKVIGRIYGTMALGAIFSPLFLGAVADKYLNMEVVIGGSHLVGALLLVVMAQMKRPWTFFAAALAYALVYSPTLSLVNAIVFANFERVGQEPENFPYIRVFGTLGWIAAGMSLKLLVRPDRPMNNRPLLLAAGLSAILGIYSLFVLPATPPSAAEEASGTVVSQADPAADTEATETSTAEEINPLRKVFLLMTVPTSAVFLLVSLVIAMAMGFYFAFAALFVEQRAGVRAQNVGPMMTIGQWVEIIFMLSLPWFIRSLGMPVVLTLGVTAWALRFAFFSYGKSFALILAAIALHGICFDFFFAAGFIHIENLAPREIRASAQSLYGVIVYGLGMYLGTEISGWLNQRFTKEVAPAVEGEPPERSTDWNRFWLVPCIGVTIALVLFIASLFLVSDPAIPEIDPDTPPQVEAMP